MIIMLRVSVKAHKIEGINRVINNAVNMTRRVRQNGDIDIIMPKQNKTPFKTWGGHESSC